MISSQAAWPEIMLCGKCLHCFHHGIGPAGINKCRAGIFVNLIKQNADTPFNTDGTIIRGNMDLDPIVLKFLHRIHMPAVTAAKEQDQIIFFIF